MFLLQQNIQMQRKNLKNKVIILWFRISIISLELTRVNPDRNIFSINVLLFYSTEVWSITITEFRNFKYFDLNLLEMSKSSLILLPTYLPTSLSFPFPPVSYHPPSLYLLYMSLDRTRTSR